MPQHDDAREQLSVAPGAPRRPLIIAAIAVAVIIVVGVAGAVVQRRGTASAPPPPPATTTSPSASDPASDSPSPSPSPSPSVPKPRRVQGASLPDIDRDWVLYGYGSGQFMTYRPATGEATSFVVPAVSTQGASLVIGHDSALVNSRWDGNGLRISPSGRARSLTGSLGGRGLLLPGPSPDLIWLAVDTGTGAVAQLLDLDGHPVQGQVRLPPESYPVEGDAAGGIIVSGVGGDYLVTRDGVRRITTGSVIAAGRTRFLTLECDDRGTCHREVVDRRSGTRRTLPSPTGELGVVASGSISPDGTVAICASGNDAGFVRIDLRTGHTDRVDTIVQRSQDSNAVVWSPDGRWAFFVGLDDTAYAIDSRTGHARSLDLTHLAVSVVAAPS